MPGETNTEAGVLLEACRRLLHPGKAVSPFDPETIDWWSLLAQASRHRLMPVLAAHVTAAPVAPGVRQSGMQRMMADIIRLNRYRNEYRARVATNLQRKLIEAGVPSLLRKGALYEQALYGGLGHRTFKDVDLFVAETLLPLTEKVLVESGFVQGWFDEYRGVVRSLSREDQIGYRLFPDHLPPMSQVADDELVRAVKVDVATTIGWHNSPFQRHGIEVVAREIELAAGAGGPPEGRLAFHFVDCCIHLFREAYFEKEIVDSRSNGVRLSKFLDTALLFESISQEGPGSIAMFIDASMRPALAWVGFHTDHLFGCDIVNAFGLGDALAEGFAFTWESASGERRFWQGDMVQRLFSNDPKFVTGSRTP